MDWSRAKLLDFTGAIPEGATGRFSEETMRIIRTPAEVKLGIILDTGFGWTSKAPAVVRDHVNLSGFNPLIGPNNPIGERFPVVQGIYQADCADKLGLERIVVAGIKSGRMLNAEDADFMHILGADCYTYNTVPTMLVAAHAGWKIISLVGPDNHSWQKDCVDKIRKLAAVAK